MRLWIAVISAMLAVAPVLRAESMYFKEVADVLDESASAPDRDSKVEVLRKALAQRGEHPANVFLERRMAVELSQYYDAESPQPLRHDEALRIYEAMLERYDYDSYYEPFDDGMPARRNGQYAMVQAAIQAGCICIYVQGDGRKGREYLYLAMEMLKRTMERRTRDWLDEPKPSPPSEADFARMHGPSDDPQWLYEYRLGQWEKRQELLRRGEVLFDY